MVTTPMLVAGMVVIVAQARAMKKKIMNAHMLGMLVEIHQLMKTLWILDWKIAI
jgi:hypothetical protein